MGGGGGAEGWGKVQGGTLGTHTSSRRFGLAEKS